MVAALEVVQGDGRAEGDIEAHHSYHLAPEVTAVLDEAEGEGEDGWDLTLKVVQ